MMPLHIHIEILAWNRVVCMSMYYIALCSTIKSSVSLVGIRTFGRVKEREGERLFQLCSIPLELYS